MSNLALVYFEIRGAEVVMGHIKRQPQGSLLQQPRSQVHTSKDHSMQKLGWHACRTKLPPKNFEIDTKNGLKNAKKDPKKTIRNAFEICFSPSQAA